MFRFLLCSFSLVLLYPTGIDLYLVGLPQIASDLAATEAQLHIAFSVYLAGMATTMFFAGTLSDKIGRKPLTLLGTCVFVVASMYGGSASDSNSFLVARFVQGIGAGTCYVVAFAILRDVLDDQRRAKVLSMINGITCVIPVLAPVIGHLIMLAFPWPTLFSVMAAMGAMVGVLCLCLLRETRLKHAQPMSTNCGKLETSERFLQHYFVRRVIMSALAVAAILTYVNASPLLLMETLGFSRGQYSSVMAATAMVSMATSFSAPLLLKHFAQTRILFTSQLVMLMATLVLLMVFVHVIPQQSMILGFGLICVGFSLGFGVVMSQALSPFTQKAGAASSLLGIAQVCFSALFIWLMGFMGIGGLEMLMIATFMSGIGGIALLSWRSRSPDQSIHEEISRTA